jgi:hypothetical protein
MWMSSKKSDREGNRTRGGSRESRGMPGTETKKGEKKSERLVADCHEYELILRVISDSISIIYDNFRACESTVLDQCHSSDGWI